jgi:hypothetical protein
VSNSNYPKAWSRFTSQNRTSNNIAKYARWSARFRLAKSFKGLDLGDHYIGEDTPQRYSAIARIFFAYSAFEEYCSSIGIETKEDDVRVLEDEESQRSAIQIIRKLDPKNIFAGFLEEHLKHGNKLMMQRFLNGQDVNVSFLAKSTRHVFAHGALAAHSMDISSECFEKISQIIANFLLNCMDQHFDKNVPDAPVRKD